MRGAWRRLVERLRRPRPSVVRRDLVRLADGETSRLESAFREARTGPGPVSLAAVVDALAAPEG